MIKNYWNRNISDNSERTSSKLQHFLEVGLHSFDIRAVFQAPEPAEKCPPAFFFGDFFSSELTASVIPWSLGHDWENFLSASLFQARKKPKLHDAMSEMYTHGRWGKPFFLFSFFVSKMLSYGPFFAVIDSLSWRSTFWTLAAVFLDDFGKPLPP